LSGYILSGGIGCTFFLDKTYSSIQKQIPCPSRINIKKKCLYPVFRKMATFSRRANFAIRCPTDILPNHISGYLNVLTAVFPAKSDNGEISASGNMMSGFLKFPACRGFAEFLGFCLNRKGPAERVHPTRLPLGRF